MSQILPSLLGDPLKLTSCNNCDYVKCLDVADKWIECKCQISKPERNKLIEIIEEITDKIPVPKWCPLLSKKGD